MSPSVDSTVKSGAVSPSCNVISSFSFALAVVLGSAQTVSLKSTLRSRLLLQTSMGGGPGSIRNFGNGTGNKIKHGWTVPFRGANQAADLTAFMINKQSRWHAFYTKG